MYPLGVSHTWTYCSPNTRYYSYPCISVGIRPFLAGGPISRLLVRYVSSVTPRNPSGPGPDGFVAYENVDDGAFGEPRRGVRPRACVKIWEYGQQCCLGAKLIHGEKKRAAGVCDTQKILRGLELCAPTETISLPNGEVGSLKSFCPNPVFCPGVARIPIRKLQELRGKAERRRVRNTPLRHELRAIGKLLRPYLGMSRPKGNANHVRKAYFDFWGSIGIIRINTPGPARRGAAYRSFLLRCTCDVREVVVRT